MLEGPDQADQTSEAPVAFVHVMKCGGTSLRQALRAVAGDLPERVKRREVIEFARETDAARKWTAGLFGMDDRLAQDMLLCNALLLPTTRIAMGHVRYASELAPLTARVHFVTILRDPVERFVSLYRWRTYGDRPFVRFDGTIEDFLDQRAELAALEGARYVTVFRGGSRDRDRSVVDGVDDAVANLRRFSVVGALHDLGRFERELTEATGLPVVIGHRNENKAKPISLDSGTRRVIEEICAPSYEVYERVLAERGF